MIISFFFYSKNLTAIAIIINYDIIEKDNHIPSLVSQCVPKFMKIQDIIPIIQKVNLNHIYSLCHYALSFLLISPSKYLQQTEF